MEGRWKNRSMFCKGDAEMCQRPRVLLLQGWVLLLQGWVLYGVGG